MTRIDVTKLPIDPGPAAWNCLLAPAGPARVVDGDIRADWVVIGAGFAGLAAARRLAQLCPTDRIVVLDARRIAEGPAGRNSGFMIDLPHDLSSADYGGALAKDIQLTADNRHAIDFAADMAAEFGMDDSVFSRCGKINGAATTKGEKHNTDYARHLTEMEEPHEVLSAAQMQAITGTTYYRSGLFTAGTAMIQPAAFIRSVAKGISSNRLQIYENSPVIGLERNGDWTARLEKGSVTAPKVILAVNGHLNSFGFKQNQLMHVFTYASMTRALTPDEGKRLGGRATWNILPADPMGTTLRRIQTAEGDRLVVRNRFTYDPSMEVDQGRVQSVGQDHDRAFAARFPFLKGVEMQYRWGGRLCLSRNNVSVVQELETGLFSACCQNGLGTTRGTLSGLMATELATGTTSDLQKRTLATAEPTTLPPAIVTRIGATALLKWQERKAGAEL